MLSVERDRNDLVRSRSIPTQKVLQEVWIPPFGCAQGRNDNEKK